MISLGAHRCALLIFCFVFRRKSSKSTLDLLEHPHCCNLFSSQLREAFLVKGLTVLIINVFFFPVIAYVLLPLYCDLCLCIFVHFHSLYNDNNYYKIWIFFFSTVRLQWMYQRTQSMFMVLGFLPLSYHQGFPPLNLHQPLC